MLSLLFSLFLLLNVCSMLSAQNLTNVTNGTDNSTIDNGTIDIKTGLNPGIAIALTFIPMFATILGSALPIIYYRYQYKSKSNIFAKPNIISKKFVAGSLGFASGSMIFGSIFHILPDSVTFFESINNIGKKYSTLCSLTFLIVGFLLFITLEYYLYKISSTNCPCISNCECENYCTCNDNIQNKVMSWLTLIAITFHHIPEGIMFYISVTTNFESGTIVGLILLIHTLPEGITIGIPTFNAFPNKKWLTILYGSIAGFGQPLGAIIGYLVFSKIPPSNFGLGITYALISGILLVTAAKGLLPYARKNDPKDEITSYTFLLGVCTILFSICMFSFVGMD